MMRNESWTPKFSPVAGGRLTIYWFVNPMQAFMWGVGYSLLTCLGEFSTRRTMGLSRSVVNHTVSRIAVKIFLALPV